jgi:negative regulator of flagellin synthesis FlgM
MKISIEEVNRLLAFTPPVKAGGSATAVTPSSTAYDASDGRAAASVEVSSTAQEVQQVKKLVNQLPDVRTDRVQALKTQIENGTYQVSGEDIADLIIRRTLADNTAL